MLLNEFTHLVDGVKAVQVAFPLRHSPGEKAVASENQAFDSWVIFDRALNQKCQFKTWSLPGNPDDLAAEFLVELFQLAFAVRAGGKGNGPVGMQMIYMGEG